MSSRSQFANSINDTGKNANLSANECERFGMAWGCKPDCPVFERGDCKDCFIENIEMFIAHGEYCKDEAIKGIELYSDRMSEEEKLTLIKEANSLQ